MQYSEAKQEIIRWVQEAPMLEEIQQELHGDTLKRIITLEVLKLVLARWKDMPDAQREKEFQALIKGKYDEQRSE